MRIELIYSEECSGFEETKKLIEEVKSVFGINEQITVVKTNDIKTLSGSPAVLIDGEDIEPASGRRVSGKQRIYEQDNQFPPRYMVEAAFLRAAKPKKILFMCVHNSARSILAEGIARHLAPSDVEILSAGSNPGGVKSEVLKVLSEIGINTAGLYSKSVQDIDSKGIDAVITLCAEEVCPVFLGKAIRLHWGLSDPSSEVDAGKRLDAFRKTRDELIKRISLIFRRDEV